MEFREALRINPNYAEAHCFLGLVFYVQVKLDEAAVEFREALRINPNYAEGHCSLGLVYEAQGKFRAAIECHQAFIKVVSPQDAGLVKEVRENIRRLKHKI